MTAENKNFFSSTCKASAIFNSKGKSRRKGKSARLDRHFMRLSLILISQLFKQAQELQRQKKLQSLSSLLSSKQFLDFSSGEKLIAILKHLDPYFLQRELSTPSYEEIVSRYHLSMKQVNFWCLSPYTCPAKEISALSNRAQKSPGVLKTHFFVPMRRTASSNELSEKEVQEELKRQQERWRLWRHHNDGDSSRVSSL